ncbi:MAG: VWA domain-containing protein [Planctomycetota bacterium]
MSGLSLLEPVYLWLGVLVAAALLLRRRAGAASVSFAPGTFLEPALPRTWRVRLLPLPRWMQLAGILLIVLALARPAHHIARPQVRDGVDILLCLDTSSSMVANDMEAGQTRLDVAKAAAARFVKARPDDRIGLLSFARFADVRCPPTLDHDALDGFLAQTELVRSDGPEDATGIGIAVARAAQLLGTGAAKSKVIVLLTDGEENVADEQKPNEIAPLHSAQLAKKLGVRVYAVAAGRGRANADGEWQALDTSQVRDLAERTGGVFFEAQDADAMANVYAEIDRLERVEFAAVRLRIEDRFLPFLAAALALLIAGRLLQQSLFRVLP